MKLSFLFVKIMFFLVLFVIDNSCLHATDLFIKAGPILWGDRTTFNASVGLDFKVANKVHLDLEFSVMPAPNSSDQYDVGSQWIMHSMLFVRFT